MAFTRRDWFFAIKVALAALLALGIAFWVDLPRPYWAVVSIYTVSQPLSGATTPKAATGCTAPFWRDRRDRIGAQSRQYPDCCVLPWRSGSGCLYFSLLDRTPRSYVLMLAGYTAAFVGFPWSTIPARFSTSRSPASRRSGSESSALPWFPRWYCRIGRSHAAKQTRPVVPRSRRPDHCNIRTQAAPDDPAPRLHLACGAVAFDALITPLQYDISTGARFADAVATLRQHMLMFLPIMTAIHDRIGALQKLNALPAAVQILLDDMAAEVRAPSLAEIRGNAKHCRPSPQPFQSRSSHGPT